MATALSDLNPRAIHRQQQVALIRLQLRFTAETHRLYWALYKWLAGVVRQSADGEGRVDEAALMATWPAVEGRWLQTHRRWVQVFERARSEAASLPFGALVVMHNHYFRPFEESRQLQESLTAEQVGALIRLWEQRRQRALDAAAERMYSDGFNLSSRVWRLEADGLNQIRRTLSLSLSERTSAARLAQLLEPLLGAGQHCPRWAYRRLYGMTPRERATSKEGLRQGDDCGSRGLAYHALRLARNEIQIAHQRMTDELFQVAPWVTGEKVRLSPHHPKPDLCDDYANGGPYQPGEVLLPLHVQCLCWKEAVVMPADPFRRQVRGWLRGENRFLDGYAGWLGPANPAQLLPWTMGPAESLALWLDNNADGHAAALGVEGA
ncbi:MAG TPA: hypothetical protein VNK95_25140 [Caldilineaceae bacterium]|nr:hypothetical protein [Caldilineaceae bacterium]